jgi:dethiobiotin synthetase
LRGLFVTGTDTGVGKTVLAAAIVAALRARGVRVRALKPVITGLDEPADADWPPDHELLARVAGCVPEEVALRRYGPPVSPHLAAALADRPINAVRLIDEIRAAASRAEMVVVEGAGGLRVPLGDDLDVRRLALALGLPLVIAARPGLGTINHTLLTLESARHVGLAIAGVVLTPWPACPSAVERSNLATVQRLGAIEVSTLARVPRADPELLRAASAGLALDAWLAASDRAGS